RGARGGEEGERGGEQRKGPPRHTRIRRGRRAAQQIGAGGRRAVVRDRWLLPPNTLTTDGPSSRLTPRAASCATLPTTRGATPAPGSADRADLLIRRSHGSH